VFALGYLVQYWELYTKVSEESDEEKFDEIYWTEAFWATHFVSQMPILAKIQLSDRQHIPTPHKTIATIVSEHNLVQSAHQPSTVMQQIVRIRECFLLHCAKVLLFLMS